MCAYEIPSRMSIHACTLRVYRHVRKCVSARMFAHLSAHVSAHMSVHMSMYMSINRPISSQRGVTRLTRLHFSNWRDSSFSEHIERSAIYLALLSESAYVEKSHDSKLSRSTCTQWPHTCLWLGAKLAPRAHNIRCRKEPQKYGFLRY